MQIRDRVRELRRVRAAALRPHPRNWRIHPATQRAALRAVLDEIGYADALVARECDDGSLELIDGHLRAETTPDSEVPVLVVDLSAAEADALLAVHDTLVGMAEENKSVRDELFQMIESRTLGMQALVNEMLSGEQPPQGNDAGGVAPEVVELYQVVVECADEAQQRTVFERLNAEGLICRVLTL